ncbi:modulator of apoptosis 1-like [Amphiura filiformis]|uniref:modulator of apoptosis 1-like n=1 Tax=Amphiura filiformis TaxID=82378 RepID=UPI003B22601F
MDIKLREFGLDWCKKADARPANSYILRSTRLLQTTQTIADSLVKSGKLEGLLHILREDEEDFTVLLCECESTVPQRPPGDITVKLAGTPNTFRWVSLGEITTISDKVTLSSSSKPMKDLALALSSSSYRKLRPFSGKTPPAKDEEAYDSWAVLVEGCLEEWKDLPDGERRRRLHEGLRTPALELINDLRTEKPDATAKDYLATLEMAYGSTETPEEIVVRLHSMYQALDETPTTFLTRVQNTIRMALRKKAIIQESANHLRLRQFIKGLVHDDILTVNLRLREMEDNPPRYMTLLDMVRRQEKELLTRNELRKKGKGVTAQTRKVQEEVRRETESSLGRRLQSLELEAKQLRSQLAKENPKVESSSYQLTSMSRPVDQGTPATPIQTPTKSQAAPATTQGRPGFCFKCGENGHMRRECPNPPNDDWVRRRLIQHVSQKQTGNPSRRQMWGNPVPGNMQN